MKITSSSGTSYAIYHNGKYLKVQRNKDEALKLQINILSYVEIGASLF